MSLRSKLIVGGIALVLIPLLILSSYSYYKVKRESLKLAEANALHTSSILAVAVEECLKASLKALQAIAVSEEAVKSSLGKQEASEQLKASLASFNKKAEEAYEVVFVTDSKGVIVSDSAGGSYKGIDVSDRDYWKKAFQGSPNIGNMILSKKSQEPVLPLAAPVYDEKGNIVGVASGALKANFLIDLVSKLKSSDSAYSFMVDHSGTVIAHPDKSLIMKLNLLQSQGLEELGKASVSGNKTIIEYVYKGTNKIAAVAPVKINNWGVGTTQSVEEFMTTANTIKKAVFIIAFLCVVVSIGLVYIFSLSITKPINRIAQGLMEGADQVATASEEVSSSSQSLAEGASEQAASIEETSSALEELSSMTKQNSENANQSASLMHKAIQAVTTANSAMIDLAHSMQEISKASEETQKIIKTIDEIAFQTNLLALNAAVEAARAGEAGAGFAVVADEVRNLAMRAAEAAKNTTILIEQTGNRINQGSQVVGKAVEAFGEVQNITSKVGSLIEEVSAASGEQREGIEQINKSVSELDKVVQKNAATAEEAAAASEELNAQAFQMREYVSHLLKIIGIERLDQEGPQSGKPKIKKGIVQKISSRSPDKKLPIKTKKEEKEISPEAVIPLDDDF